MGRQINFFLAPDDQKAFEAAIASAGPVVFMRPTNDARMLERVRTTILENYGAERLRLIAARPEDAINLATELAQTENGTGANPTTQPIIEFDRSFVDSGFIRAGRLYYTAFFYDSEGQKTDKNEAFLQWAETVFRKVKAPLSRRHDGWYVGPQAQDLAEHGVQLRHL